MSTEAIRLWVRYPDMGWIEFGRADRETCKAVITVKGQRLPCVVQVGQQPLRQDVMADDTRVRMRQVGCEVKIERCSRQGFSYTVTVQREGYAEFRCYADTWQRAVDQACESFWTEVEAKPVTTDPPSAVRLALFYDDKTDHHSDFECGRYWYLRHIEQEGQRFCVRRVGDKGTMQLYNKLTLGKWIDDERGKVVLLRRAGQGRYEVSSDQGSRVFDRWSEAVRYGDWAFFGGGATIVEPSTPVTPSTGEFYRLWRRPLSIGYYGWGSNNPFRVPLVGTIAAEEDKPKKESVRRVDVRVYGKDGKFVVKTGKTRTDVDCLTDAASTCAPLHTRFDVYFSGVPAKKPFPDGVKARFCDWGREIEIIDWRDTEEYDYIVIDRTYGRVDVTRFVRWGAAMEYVFRYFWGNAGDRG